MKTIPSKKKVSLQNKEDQLWEKMTEGSQPGPEKSPSLQASRLSPAHIKALKMAFYVSGTVTLWNNNISRLTGWNDTQDFESLVALSLACYGIGDITDIDSLKQLGSFGLSTATLSALFSHNVECFYNARLQKSVYSDPYCLSETQCKPNLLINALSKIPLLRDSGRAQLATIGALIAQKLPYSVLCNKAHEMSAQMYHRAQHIYYQRKNLPNPHCNQESCSHTSGIKEE